MPNWNFIPALALVVGFLAPTGTMAQESPSPWSLVETVGRPNARHEAAFVVVGDRFYLLGGRGIKPVDIYDPSTKAWSEGPEPPIEVHHFQPVVITDEIWLAGAMTGPYPRETALERILIFDTKAGAWRWGPEIPKGRRRGGAGAILHDGSLYLACGIQNGHWDGWVPWLDRFDLESQQWTRLPDAPRSRDHFQLVALDDQLVLAGGRRTSGVTGEVFELTIPEVDVYQVKDMDWTTLPGPQGHLPTPRAGGFNIVVDSEVWALGGESGTQGEAHDEVEALDLDSGSWRVVNRLLQGRHGTGALRHAGGLYVCSGCGRRGGSPELETMERMTLD